MFTKTYPSLLVDSVTAQSWALVVTQLVERSIPAPEVRGSNPVNGEILFLYSLSTVLKLKNNGQFLKNYPNLSSDCYYEISNTKMFLKMGKPRPLFPLFLVFYNTISTEKNCRLQFSNSYCQSQRRSRLTLDHPHGPRIQNSKFKINLDLHVFFHLQNYLS